MIIGFFVESNAPRRSLGSDEGLWEELADGSKLGCALGYLIEVGAILGNTLGEQFGWEVGTEDGIDDGDFVGLVDGE